MRTTKVALLLALVVGMAGACEGDKRGHVMTDADVAAAAAAKARAMAMTSAAEQGTVTWTDTEQTQHALHCVQESPVYGFCLVYAPDPPSGMWDCGGDYNAYSGEFLIFTSTNGSGYCAGCNYNDPSHCHLGAIGDYDNQVRSTKNNSGHPVGVWSDPWYVTGPSTTIVSDGGSAHNVPSGMENTISSFYAW